MASTRDIKRTGWREALGILLLAASILVFLSQLSYLPADVPLLQDPPQRPAGNFIGPMGAWLAFALFMVFGVAAYLVPLALGASGLLLVISTEIKARYRALWMGAVLLAMTVVVEMQEALWSGLAEKLNLPSAGGTVGYFLGERGLIQLIGAAGTTVLCTALLLVSLIFLFDLRLVQIWQHLVAAVKGLMGRAGEALDARRERQSQIEKEEKVLARQRKKLERSVRSEARPGRGAAAPVRPEPAEPVFARTIEDVVSPQPEPEPEPLMPEPPPRPPPKPVVPPDAVAALESAAPIAPPTPGESDDAEGDDEDLLTASPVTAYRLPDRTLLDEITEAPLPTLGPDLESSARVLEDTMKDFGIACKVTNVEQGPVVTRYEILPAAGVRVERIAGLSNNIALALKALSVRIQAPIPGKGVVGIEVPNGEKAGVYLRQLLEQPKWDQSDYALPLALGKDVGGRVLIADLAAMPHLLIAGATGAGKSVCINAILAGLLMSRTPDEMRLMLVDPKIVEFAPYNGLPHLVVPVITDPKKVAIGLRWAIKEMEKRYKMFAKVGVRNIKDFNERPRVKQTDLFGDEAPADKREAGIPEKLPYIAIIIDELADLMLVAQADVENAIARLAQLSRAVGIHMIIATQRPSVNVITGTIKANFPARIAFQVAQKVDSRTILDTVGAEHLLGKGDMLVLPPGGSKTVRAQGAFVSDEELRRLVEFWTAQSQPEFVSEIQEKIENKQVELPDGGEDDDLLDAAIEVIRQTRRASTSSLQRRLRIGYTRAARLMDVLEEKGIIGAPQGSEPREILIDLDGEIPQNPPDESEPPLG